MGRGEGKSGEGVRKTIMMYLYENATKIHHFVCSLKKLVEKIPLPESIAGMVNLRLY